MAPRFTSGQYFTVPLLGHGYAHGYLTHTTSRQMLVAAIHDCLTETPDLPENIEDIPLILPNLRIDAAAFSIPAKLEQYQGRKWIKHKKIHSGVIEPAERYYILGANRDPRIWDIMTGEILRPATKEEEQTLQNVGFDLVPGPTAEIEIALLRLDIPTWEFDPASVRRQ